MTEDAVYTVPLALLSKMLLLKKLKWAMAILCIACHYYMFRRLSLFVNFYR
jgi:hypothetical protein